MTNPNSQRWVDLSEKYKKLLSASNESAFVAGRVAMHLQEALAEACGCGPDQVIPYKYEYGYAPEADTSEKVKTGFDAVGLADDGWVFGLGVQLEVSPNGHPKTVMVFPVNLRIDRDAGSVTVTSAMFEGKEVIGQDYRGGLTKVAEKMFEGLDQQLDLWLQGGKPKAGIGFNTN